MNTCSHSRLAGAALALWLLAITSLSAEQFGLFTYRVDGDQITITDYPDDAVGEAVIPLEIGGMPVTDIDAWAFSGCSSLASVSIPEGVISLGSYAFADCPALASIIIPGSLTSIGDAAFYGCTALNSVTIPEGVTEIGYSAFSNCNSLASVTIPGSVTEIRNEAFIGCTSLASITIPASVTFIGSSAFSDCTSLASVAIPGSVNHISSSAFSGCTGLQAIIVDEINPNYASEDGVLFDSDVTILIHCPGGKTGTYTIPGSVTEIESEAFSGCSNLASITIPGSVIEIGYSAFFDCTSLATIDVGSMNSNYSSIDGVLFNKEGTELIRYPASRSGEYAIPPQVTSLRSRVCFSGRGGR